MTAHAARLWGTICDANCQSASKFEGRQNCTPEHILSNNAVLGTLKPGQHGSTFGGNSLACAVARAALRVLVEEGMIS
jgi:hypothetical protein